MICQICDNEIYKEQVATGDGKGGLAQPPSHIDCFDLVRLGDTCYLCELAIDPSDAKLIDSRTDKHAIHAACKEKLLQVS